MVFLVQWTNLTQKIDVFKSAKWPYLTLAILLFPANILIQVHKWHFLLKSAQPAATFSSAFKSLMVAYPLGFITPGRLGEFSRAFFIVGMDSKTAFQLFLVDKLSNLIITLTAGAAGAVILFRHQLTFNLNTLLMTLFLLAGSLTILLVFGRSKWHLAIQKFISKILSHRNSLFKLLSFSALFYVIFLLQFIALIENFQSVNFWMAACAAASVFLVKSLLPISLGDLGIREGAAVFFLHQIAVAPAAAFNAALLLYLLNVALPSLAGLGFLLKMRRPISSPVLAESRT